MERRGSRSSFWLADGHLHVLVGQGTGSPSLTRPQSYRIRAPPLCPRLPYLLKGLVSKYSHTGDWAPPVKSGGHFCPRQKLNGSTAKQLGLGEAVTPSRSRAEPRVRACFSLECCCPQPSGGWPGTHVPISAHQAGSLLSGPAFFSPVQAANSRTSLRTHQSCFSLSVLRRRPVELVGNANPRRRL